MKLVILPLVVASILSLLVSSDASSQRRRVQSCTKSNLLTTTSFTPTYSYGSYEINGNVMLGYIASARVSGGINPSVDAVFAFTMLNQESGDEYSILGIAPWDVGSSDARSSASNMIGVRHYNGEVYSSGIVQSTSSAFYAAPGDVVVFKLVTDTNSLRRLYMSVITRPGAAAGLRSGALSIEDLCGDWVLVYTLTSAEALTTYYPAAATYDTSDGAGVEILYYKTYSSSCPPVTMPSCSTTSPFPALCDWHDANSTWAWWGYQEYHGVSAPLYSYSSRRVTLNSPSKVTLSAYSLEAETGTMQWRVNLHNVEPGTFLGKFISLEEKKPKSTAL